MFGVLAVDKPAGKTSRDIVNQIQRVIRSAKVGHTGTLDPLATGVLLIAIGPATRLVEFSHAARKTYQAEFELGKSSDTMDIEGQVTLCPPEREVTQALLESELPRWTGPIQQVPPKYSAIQIGGKRAYDLARNGKEFELPPRPVEIHRLELLDFQYPRLRLEIECGTGTYIRSLGSDIARSLGTDAVMTRLVRTAVGDVPLADCVAPSDELDRERIATCLLPPLVLLSAFPQVQLTANACQRIRHGIPLELGEVPRPASPVTQAGPPSASCVQPLAACDESGNLVAMLIERDGRFRSLRVFHPE